jgi:hypothetical protein
MAWGAEKTCLIVFPMHKNQHPFRKNHSCDISLGKDVTEIEKSITTNQFSLGIFMDIEGAFDNLTYTAIEARMIRDRFPLS